MNNNEATSAPVNAELLASVLKRVKRAYAKHTKWLQVCTEPNVSLRSMPSKASKHRMYADASQLMRVAGWNDERPHTLAEIGALIERAS